MADPTSLAHFSTPLMATLAARDVTEVCINQPGEVWIEYLSGWRKCAAPWASFDWGMHFARLLAAATQQRLSSQHPLLTAALPAGERVQVVLPPATEAGRVAIAVRKNALARHSLAELIENGLAADCTGSVGATHHDDSLARAYQQGLWGEFLREAVRARQNILVSGPTGSGKTTLTRALIGEVPPHERLVTIEDAPELSMRDGTNAVRLFYSKDDQGLSRLTARHLLEACLRLRPERILLAELRGAEAYQYLRAVNSGHPGSITSIHASSCALAFEQLALMVKESDAGRDMPRADIHALLAQVVDVVVHCERIAGSRRIRQVWWRAAAKDC